MGRWEEASEATERAAATLEETLKAALRGARALRAAAAAGDSAKVRRVAAALPDLGGAVADAARQAATAWPFSDAEEEHYLERGYAAELTETAQRANVRIDPLDGRLVSFPSLLRIVPSQRAIRIDTKRHTALRPSKIVEALRRAREAKPRLAPEQFIETLFGAYLLAVGGRDNITKGATLVDVYRVLTLHPDMKRSYERAEFVRDVYLLDASGLRHTKQGLEIRFPAATATRSSTNLLQIVDAEGRTHLYYGIRFQETPQ